VTALAEQVHNRPVPLPHLQVIQNGDTIKTTVAS
jgi:hypothetical protein